MAANDVAPLPSEANIEAPSSIEHATAPAPSNTTTPSGEHFIAWLREGIQTRRLIINDAKALVHTVAGSVFLVSPGVFQRFAQEHPEVTRFAKQEQQTEWAWIQKHFERLGVHRKQDNGLNIWTCEVTGPRKNRRLHGYILKEPARLFAAKLHDNPYLKLSSDPHQSQGDDHSSTKPCSTA